MSKYNTRAERRAALRERAGHVLTPAFRRWAYGLAVAALGVAIWADWLPATVTPVAVPLLMALFFVDKTGEPRP
ncbi:hypothetical protein [Microbacterium sp. AR7-10]|uniref:hypothetical protein n=1 Tax=Microbacterium sp. AR7-10 TaxID=1891970 RepID=UPI0008FCC8C9|nr:hypothetical protein [Microbacterium sp. AR7-10]OIU84602.1 hypothetical protein BFN01_02105 [Microbacterium sp. AR7-10]